mmetsp:Transcript_17347/g.12397  ORF Transcript_17347/g.12397 Transcript_17347/m.12397 type:complete len:148 (+) Transcript_17347:66-509(+)
MDLEGDQVIITSQEVDEEGVPLVHEKVDLKQPEALPMPLEEGSLETEEQSAVPDEKESLPENEAQPEETAPESKPETGVHGIGMVLFYMVLIAAGTVAAIYAYFSSMKKFEEEQKMEKDRESFFEFIAGNADDIFDVRTAAEKEEDI